MPQAGFETAIVARRRSRNMCALYTVRTDLDQIDDLHILISTTYILAPKFLTLSMTSLRCRSVPMNSLRELYRPIDINGC
jgi:hypothetical protein